MHSHYERMHCRCKSASLGRAVPPVGRTQPPLHLREQREKAQVETSNLSNTDSLLKVDKNFRMVFIEI